jgi:hypothetical protein
MEIKRCSCVLQDVKGKFDQSEKGARETERGQRESKKCVLMTCLLTRRGGNGICPRSLCPAGSASRMSGNTLAGKAPRRSRCTRNRAVGCGSGPPVGPWRTAGWRESSGPRPQARSTCWLALAEAGGGLHTSSILRTSIRSCTRRG